jgi:hypothetical protein
MKANGKCRMKYPSVLVVSLGLALAGCSPSDDSLTVEEYNQVSQEITAIRRAWFKSRPRMNYGDTPYNVFLVIDTNVPAMWLERDGRINDSEKCQLPTGLQWQIYHVTPQGKRLLQSPVRLKQRTDASQEDITQELLLVYAYDPQGCAGMHFTIADSGNSCGWGKLDHWQYHWGSKPDKPDAVERSFIVTPQEYDATNG